jgi:hypothetical protein
MRRVRRQLWTTKAVRTVRVAPDIVWSVTLLRPQLMTPPKRGMFGRSSSDRIAALVDIGSSSSDRIAALVDTNLVDATQYATKKAKKRPIELQTWVQ